MQPPIRRLWAVDEDENLGTMVETHGAGQWGEIAHVLDGRSASMCRERYHYHLSPDVHKRDWLPEEDALVLAAPRDGRWAAAVAKQLYGRSVHAVRNRAALLRNHATREEGSSLDDGKMKARVGAQPAAALAPGHAQPEHANMSHSGGGRFFSGGSFFGGGSFSIVGRPPARLLQPVGAGRCGMVPIMQPATTLFAPAFPCEPSFVSIESSTTLPLFAPPPLPSWPALGGHAVADTEAEAPFMPATVGLDATLELENCDAWIEAIDAAILALGHNVLGAVA